MAFGKGFKQSDGQPPKNNYCGGYAMAAILNDKDDAELWQPKMVYDTLLEQQEDVVALLQEMVNEKKCNGTDIVLPSSLVLFARKMGLLQNFCMPKIWTFRRRSFRKKNYTVRKER